MTTAKGLYNTVKVVTPSGYIEAISESGALGTKIGKQISKAIQNPKEAYESVKASVINSVSKVGDYIQTKDQEARNGDWGNLAEDYGYLAGNAQTQVLIGVLTEGATRTVKSSVTLGTESSLAAQKADFISTSLGLIKNEAAIDSSNIIYAQEGMQVVRWANSPLKTGIKAIEGSGGSWATTVEEANAIPRLSFGNWKISWSNQVSEGAALPPWCRPKNSWMPMFGKVKNIPVGTPYQVGIVQEAFGSLGGAPELYFP